MMTECTASEPVRDMLNTPESLKPQHIPLPSGQTSPRSPLECDFLSSGASTSSKTPGRKLVSFSPTVLKVPSVAKGSSGRKVSFSKIVHHKEIRHIAEYSEEEKQLIWMTPQDYYNIKSIVKSTVIKMMRGVRIEADDEELCSRGLEFRTKAGSKMRSRNKLRTRSAVLNEQDLQYDEGFSDPQYIAMASMDESRECKDGALMRGKYDEACIQSYLDDTREWIKSLG